MTSVVFSLRFYKFFNFFVSFRLSFILRLSLFIRTAAARGHERRSLFLNSFVVFMSRSEDGARL